MKLKLVPLILSTFIFSSPLVLADSSLSVTSGVSVYVDPILKNHKTYPVTFGDRLESKINILERETGIKYYVFLHKIDSAPELAMDSIWGINRGKVEVSRTINKLKADKGFPEKKYVVIDYVRNPADPSESAINFISSEDLTGPSISEIFTKFMPQDPEGAIYGIAESIANGEKFLRIFVSAACVILSFLLTYLAFPMVDFSIKDICDRRIKEWEKAIATASAVNEEIIADGTIQFCLGLGLSKSPEVAKAYLDELQHLLFVASTALSIAKRQRQMFMFGKAISTLDSNHIVEKYELPLNQVSIFEGLDAEVSFKGDQLLCKLNESVSKTTDILTALKKYN
ncbi:MAG: hypothetical protein ACRC62_18365 [Microcoleus sp.]